MRAPVVWLLLGCLLAVVLLFFWPVLFQDQQFGYRDAAHYYYPLYQRVEQEWSAGRIPLWEPEENSGMPLLGNPTAAVLYPLKLIYRLAPSYAWGARLYSIVHVVLCFVGMWLLVRSWNVSPGGASLAALAYTLAGPVLFQTCNIIFLVGAAWAPFGLWAVDRWLRRGERRALPWLALFLTLQVLGGDPEAAYIIGLCAVGYAFALSQRENSAIRRGIARHVAVGLAVVAAWVLVTLVCAAVLRRTPEQVGKPPAPHPWLAYTPWAIRAGWCALAVLAWNRLIRDRDRGRVSRRLGGLLLAAVVGAFLSGAQLLPVLEFTSQSLRAADGAHEVYPFSLEPIRVAELAWPGFFGSASQGERLWLRLATPDHMPEIWVNSLYLGGVTVWLALAIVSLRKGPPQRVWMTAILLLSLLAAFGRFSSPLWVARFVPKIAQVVGPHDPPNTPAIRFDGAVRDGEGGLYWAMCTFLPGFGSFRYPSKLLTFTCLALAALAGMGWDSLLARERRARAWIVPCGAALSLGLLVAAYVSRPAILAYWAARAPKQLGGIFDSASAWSSLTASLIQGFVVAIGLWVVLKLGRRWQSIALALVVALQLGDLTYTNREHVITVPQSLFETPPHLLELIRQAERNKPTPGGYYRVYRMPVWEPYGWREVSDRDRYLAMVRWERRTIQPKYAIPYGMDYSFTKGVAELYDYEFFFTAFERSVRDPELARQIFGDQVGQKLVVYTRRGIDLWNSRYFVLPYRLSNDEARGIAAFLPDTELIAPVEPSDEPAEAKAQRLREWARDEDWRLMRNNASFPRAWVVHEAHTRSPIAGRKDRDKLMLEILYPNDALWSEGVAAIDTRTFAWVETAAPHEVRPFLSHRTPLDAEQPRIVRYEPQHVELAVDLQSPGIVVLADVYYPGWKLTIDGKPAEMLRTNRLMRGALVPSGSHKLVYKYEPLSFYCGVAASGLGVMSLFGLWWFGRRGPSAVGAAQPRTA